VRSRPGGPASAETRITWARPPDFSESQRVTRLPERRSRTSSVNCPPRSRRAYISSGVVELIAQFAFQHIWYNFLVVVGICAKTNERQNVTLRDVRKQRGWSQNELARRAQCSQQWVSAIERTLPKILRALTSEDQP
jgi:DNA-binding XRE family transcriptional regulator